MLKYKDMWNVYTNDEGFSMDDPQGVFNLADAKAMLEQALASHSIPVTITSDTVKCGGLFSKDDRECLVLTSTEHKRNYYQYVLIIKTEYGRTYLTYCKMGQSKDMGKEAAKQGAREARNSYASQQGGLGAHLGAAMGNAIGGIGAGKRQARIESEKNYYNLLENVVEETMSAMGLV